MIAVPSLILCRYRITCRVPDGSLRWDTGVFDNLVTTAGKNLNINVMWGATSKSANWYVLLKGAGTAAAADTAASHAGWSEVTAYAESVRQTATFAAASGGASSNTASPAVFTINGSAPIAGAGLIDNNTKGGSSGSLYSVGDFGAPLTVVAADVVTVTVSLV